LFLVDERLEQIAAQLKRHATADGEIVTAVPGVKLYRASSTATIQRGILRPSVCVVAQGEERVEAGELTLRYGAGDFIASAIDMPVTGHAVAVSAARPYLAVAFELGPDEVLSVLSDAQIRVPAGEATPAAFVGPCDARLLDVVSRAVTSLDDEREARFLAPLLRRELAYRLVTGRDALRFCQSALAARSDEGVGRAVDWLRSHYKKPLSVPQLARLARMSTSSLHHKFKAMVLMGPLQYQKRLRLEEARRLLIAGLADATSAAFDVGYESPTQFNREYRRHFGLPPLRDIKRMRSEAASTTRTKGR
jgi:AraC-like DNA-binding protein